MGPLYGGEIRKMIHKSLGQKAIKGRGSPKGPRNKNARKKKENIGLQGAKSRDCRVSQTGGENVPLHMWGRIYKERGGGGGR